MKEPLVSVLCATFNHESYIGDALEGFISQKTSFAFEVIVNDDASSDSTASIIKKYQKKYPDIIRPIFQVSNQFSKGKSILRDIMLPEARGKYIAFCEGDDYWIDPNKLQIQVDYLETNSDIGLVYTDIDFIDENTKTTLKSVYKNRFLERPETFEELLTTMGYIAPPTWLIKKESLLETYTTYPEKPIVDGTFCIGLSMLAEGKVHFLDKATSTYRIHNNSLTHTKDEEKINLRKAGLLRIQQHYIGLYTHIFLDELKKKKEQLALNAVRANEELLIVTRNLEQINAEKNAIMNSKSYKIACIITHPLRVIKKLIKNTLI